MGLSSHRHSWSAEQSAFVVANYGVMPTRLIARKVQRTPEAVKAHAQLQRRLARIARDEEYMQRVRKEEGAA